jgi:hypothetical protein
MLYDSPRTGKHDYWTRGAWRRGHQFGQWQILALLEPDPSPGAKRIHRFALCQCSCGNQKPVNLDSLIRGSSTRCRRCDAATRGRAIGVYYHPDPRVRKVHKVWSHMIRRCSPGDHRESKNYYQRGIRICDEWTSDFWCFWDWAIANGFTDGLTIDRVDNEGHYTPANCRWVTNQLQQRNKRTNHILTAFGESKPVSAWAEDPRCVVGVKTLYTRLYLNWDAERAIATPIRSGGTR